MKRDNFPDWMPVQPPDGIPCKDCAYRLEDSSPWGYKKAHCDKYPGNQPKPVGVLFMGKECEHYKKEKGGA
jgi:hypothetical protein